MAGPKNKTGKRRKSRYFWSTYEVRLPDWLLERAGILPGDRVIATTLESGIVIVAKV